MMANGLSYHGMGWNRLAHDRKCLIAGLTIKPLKKGCLQELEGDGDDTAASSCWLRDRSCCSSVSFAAIAAWSALLTANPHTHAHSMTAQVDIWCVARNGGGTRNLKLSGRREIPERTRGMLMTPKAMARHKKRYRQERLRRLGGTVRNE